MSDVAVQRAQEATHSAATPRAAERATQSGASLQLKRSLIGHSYQDQLQMLAPGRDHGDPVQRLDGPAPASEEADAVGADSEEQQAEAPQEEEATADQGGKADKKKRKLFRFGKKKGGAKEEAPGAVPAHDANAFSKKQRRKRIAKACMAALPMVNKAIARTDAGDPLFQTWIDGSNTEQSKMRAALVLDVLRKVKQFLEEDQIHFKKYALDDGEKLTTYAYVNQDEQENNIYLGGRFWGLGTHTHGKNSRAGTIIHELTHRLSGTQDHVYGGSKCRKLARDEPRKAKENADNIEYLCEHA